MSYQFAGCTTVNCPRDIDPGASMSLSKSRMHQDHSGNYWCPACQKRCALMDYGHEHHWPEVRAVGQQGRYAILGEQSEWFISLSMGDQDLVDAFYAELIGTEQV